MKSFVAGIALALLLGLAATFVPSQEVVAGNFETVFVKEATIMGQIAEGGRFEIVTPRGTLVADFGPVRQWDRKPVFVKNEQGQQVQAFAQFLGPLQIVNYRLKGYKDGQLTEKLTVLKETYTGLKWPDKTVPVKKGIWSDIMAIGNDMAVSNDRLPADFWQIVRQELYLDDQLLLVNIVKLHAAKGQIWVLPLAPTTRISPPPSLASR